MLMIETVRGREAQLYSMQILKAGVIEMVRREELSLVSSSFFSLLVNLTELGKYTDVEKEVI